MRKLTKKTLKVIDSVLSGEDRDAAKELWHVLTALRGQDYDLGAIGSKMLGINYIKIATTALIRANAFPKTCKLLNSANIDHLYIYAVFEREDHKNSVSLRKELPENHFIRHARAAFSVLDLKWDEKNKT